MKKIILGISSALALMLSAMPANAGSDGFGFDPYIGLGIGTVQIKQSGILNGPPAFRPFPNGYEGYSYISMGVRLHKYFDAELRYGRTWQDTNAASNLNQIATADYIFSALAKPKLYMTRNSLIYGLVGWSKMKYAGHGVGTANFNTAVGTNVVSGFSFGGGVEYITDNHFTVGGEYIRYLSNVDATPPTPNQVTVDSFDLFAKYQF